MPKPPPRLTRGGVAPTSSASSRGERDRRGLGLDQRLGIERLRAGEDVEAAPVGAGVEDAADERGHARGVDPERLGAAAHPHARALDLEIGIDPDREPRRPRAPIASARSTSPSDSQLRVTPASIAASRSLSRLPGPAKLIVGRIGARLEREAQLAARGDVEAVDLLRNVRQAADDSCLLLWHNASRRPAKAARKRAIFASTRPRS